jgi:hypothetical protein
MDANQEILADSFGSIEAISPDEAGTYVNRSYRIFDDPQQWLSDFKKSPKVKERFRDHVRANDFAELKEMYRRATTRTINVQDGEGGFEEKTIKQSKAQPGFRLLNKIESEAELVQMTDQQIDALALDIVQHAANKGEVSKLLGTIS